MKKPLPKINTSSLDELFTSEEQRQEAKLEKIMELPISDIQEFKNHPFKVRQDEQMLKLIDSVTENGILVPTLVRPSQDGNGYEMVLGHRRMKAAELNGLDKVPAIVRDLTDDQATIIMADSNIQRETILPTERGFAYKMKLEAMKHQGKRVYSVEKLADEVGESRNQVKRYIRLTELIEPLRDMVDSLREDKKKIAFNPAVELSYLSKDNQELVVKSLKNLI